MGGSAAVRRLYWESGRWCTSGEDCGSVKACNDDGVCPHECDKQKKSVAFLFPEVTSQIEGDGEAITPETFRKLLSEIKEKEMAGALQVMTYYQYYQYRVQCQAEAEVH